MLQAFIPIWFLTGLGYLAARSRILPERADQVLSSFVFHLAMPATLIGTLSRTSLRHFDAIALAAFGLSTAGAFLLSWYLTSRPQGERVIAAMAGGYVNAGNLGIPIALQVLGTISFLTEVLLLQVLVITPMIFLALDRKLDPRRMATLPIRNPIVLAAGVGVALSALGLQIPSFVDRPLSLLAATAVPMALLALGTSLATPPAPDEVSAPVTVRETVAVVTVKVLVQPALGYAIGHWVFGLNGRELLAVVLCAALPTAQNTFIYARTHLVPTVLARRSIVITTLAAMLTLPAIAGLLA